MLNYDNFLTELFNTPMGIIWTTDNDKEVIGSFKQGKNKYIIEAKERYNNDNVWSYSFYLINTDPTEPSIYHINSIEKKHLAVLSTIVKGLKYIIKSKNPKIILFHCTKEEANKANVYKNMVQRESWNFILAETKKNHLFILYKNSEDIKLVNKIIEMEIKTDKK